MTSSQYQAPAVLLLHEALHFERASYSKPRVRSVIVMLVIAVKLFSDKSEPTD